MGKAKVKLKRPTTDPWVCIKVSAKEEDDILVAHSGCSGADIFLSVLCALEALGGGKGTMPIQVKEAYAGLCQMRGKISPEHPPTKEAHADLNIEQYEPDLKADEFNGYIFIMPTKKSADIMVKCPKYLGPRLLIGLDKFLREAVWVPGHNQATEITVNIRKEVAEADKLMEEAREGAKKRIIEGR